IGSGHLFHLFRPEVDRDRVGLGPGIAALVFRFHLMPFFSCASKHARSLAAPGPAARHFSRQRRSMSSSSSGLSLTTALFSSSSGTASAILRLRQRKSVLRTASRLWRNTSSSKKAFAASRE